MLPLLEKFMKSYEDLDKQIDYFKGLPYYDTPDKACEINEILNFEVGMTDPATLAKLNEASRLQALSKRSAATKEESHTFNRDDVYRIYESVPVKQRKDTFKTYYNELKNNPTISEERQKEILTGIVKIGQDQEFKKLVADGKYSEATKQHNPIDKSRSYVGLFLKCIREIIAFVPRVAWTVGHSAIKLSFQNHMCNPLNTASRNKVNDLTKVVAELEQEENSSSSQIGRASA